MRATAFIKEEDDILLSQKLVRLALEKRCPKVEGGKSEGVCKSIAWRKHREGGKSRATEIMGPSSQILEGAAQVHSSSATH